MTTTTPPDAPERSYRRLCLMMLHETSMKAMLMGRERANEGNFKEAKQCALDAYELLRAIKWLEGLPAELCPPVELATYEELKAEAQFHQAMKGTAQ